MVRTQNSQSRPDSYGNLQSLQQLSPPRFAAVLFSALAGQTLEDTVSLTWERALQCRRLNLMGELPWYVAQLQPRHLRSQYVFWEDDRNPRPLFGLDADVFETTGRVWCQVSIELAATV